MACHRVSQVSVATAARRAAELRRLELLVTRRLDGLLRGEFLGIRPGPGTDFSGTRPYEVGDDARRIDWNLSARSLAPFIRTTDADRELHTWVVVDRSASMNFGTTQQEKADVAFAALAAFGFLTSGHGNTFGAIASGGDRLVRLGPSSTRPGLMATLSRLYDAPRRETPPADNADLAAALRLLERTSRRRGQIVVVSDFLDGSEWSAQLRRLSFAHQVLAVQVVDPREFELPAMGLLTLVDAETGREVRVQSNATSLRERYARAASDRHEQIGAAIRAAQSDHLVLSTDRDWLIDIAQFIAGRRTSRRAADPERERGIRTARLRSVQ
jgi:uncharacterized protein (DUF58 family)